ncbi:MAG: bifunctional folylpolyglutamate synthase/dihydrofolate synthase [Campylobacterota bacterium]|nr:bifunctional folylpolyglutamate synthase/dihydrofolate synthase [Campylobacterota bacterium]
MLEDYLNKKPLYYTEIDYTRMPRIYEKIKEEIPKPKIIHLVGTNGKGTTGRFLASALYSLGFSTGHYTSPHILEFNERIWLNGENSSQEVLEKAHEKLQKILTKSDANSLSYFEYTTLLSQIVFNECEFVVLEAGLGGEYDATAVFDKILTLVTPIDFDHEAFLGDTIKEIATTKLNAVQKNAIIAKQKYSEVMKVANELADIKRINLKTIDDILDAQDKQIVDNISKKLDLVDYLKDNLSLSVSALKFLNIEIKESSFDNATLFGRLTKYSSNIILDVGHNTLAASSIFQALKSKKFVLVYNSYKDKNYKEILNILKPLIDRVEIINVDDSRIELKEKLQNFICKLNLECKDFKKCNVDENYLVFGSFSVVESFLKMQEE